MASAVLAMPIVQWALGHPGLAGGVTLAVLLQVSLVVLCLAQPFVTRRATATLVIVVTLAYGAELIGSRTGLPFAAYHYTEQLQPQLWGVPLLIPLAWLMMLPPAWAVAQRITGQVSGPAFVLVSALAFTAWDLYVDPQMAYWGLWAWDVPGAYFGIPLGNFAGWLLVSALITAIARPGKLPQMPLLSIYVLMWIVEAVVQIAFWRLYYPALCGFLGMGFWVVLARRKARAAAARDDNVILEISPDRVGQPRQIARSPDRD